MSEESQIFLKELHFLISDTVRVAENMLTSHEITPNDFLGGMSIAAPCLPVIAALMCTTKRSVEGVRNLVLMGLQKQI